MAQFVDTKISLEGKSINQFTTLSLSQNISEHHSFRLVCPSSAIDGTTGAIFNSSKNMIGGSITIEISSIGSTGKFKFSGVVTMIESARHSGHAGDIIISGFSPTILMDNVPNCKSWGKKSIKNISQDVLQDFPQNLLNPKINPTFGDTLSYTVQYKETAWQFIRRLSANFGEWFMYDGQKLVLGPVQGEKSNLIFGNNLSNFDMMLELRPSKFQAKAFDYMNFQVYEGQPTDIANKAGLSELGKFTLKKSEEFYDTQPKYWLNHFLTNKKQLDDFVNTRASIQSSNMIRFSGNSDYPGLQLGSTASIQGKNVFSNDNESFGDYTIISVSHHCDGQGNYSNDFISIPASVKMPPIPYVPDPMSETQSAKVTDNNDPDGLGRIRIRFHWMNDTEKTPWLRITSPHGGDGKGMFFIPEIGEEVIVGFEGNSPTKPFILGTVYNSNAKTSFSNAGNDVKALQTRSGNMIVMNDNEGSVHVADAKGNDIKIDGSGNINITSSESIVLTCGQSKIEMKKDGTINVEGKEITIKATDKATMQSGQASFKADGQGNEAAMDGMKANISGTSETNVKGMKTTVSADTEVDINGNAQVSIGSSAMVAVKGAMITLN